MAKGRYIWFNGKILREEEVRISLFTHSLHYGVGAFEGIRAYKQKNGGGAIFRLTEHMQRLHETFKILGYDVPFSVDALCDGAVSICKQNGFDECYVRPLVYIGDGPLGLSIGENPPIDVAILNWEWGSYLGDDGIEKGIKLKMSSYIRPHVNSLVTKAKVTGQYVTNCLAKREAIAAGCSEALLVDTEGYISEGTGENIFMVKDGIVKTTPLTSILNGITRQTTMLHLKHQGYTVIEERFTKDELWCADEIFLTGTAAEITPVVEIDRRKIGFGAQTGVPGPVTRKMQKDYSAIVRGDVPAYGAKWLTPIK